MSLGRGESGKQSDVAQMLEQDAAIEVSPRPTERFSTAGQDSLVGPGVREHTPDVLPLRPLSHASNMARGPGRLLLAGGVLAVVLVATGVYWWYADISRTALLTLNIQTTPVGVTVHVGGKSCLTPCALELKPGHYEISAESSGFSAIRKSIDFRKNQTERLDLVAMPPPAVTVQAPTITGPGVAERPGESTTNTPNPDLTVALKGTLEVQAGMENVRVYLDGRAIGYTGRGGSYKGEVDAGTHTVRVEKGGYVSPAPKTVIIAEKGKSRVPFDPLKQIITPPALSAGQSASDTGAAQPPTISAAPPPFKLPDAAKPPPVKIPETPSAEVAATSPVAPSANAPRQSSAEALSKVINQYKALYYHPNAGELRAIWPGISQKDLKKWEDYAKLRTDAVDFRPDQPKIANDTATVRGRLSIHVVGQGKSTTTELEIHLKNRAGDQGEDWVIESVQ